MRHMCALAAFLLVPGCGDGGGGSVRIGVSDELAGRSADRDGYTKPLGAALRVEPARDDRGYLDQFATTFTSMTPESTGVSPDNTPTMVLFPLPLGPAIPRISPPNA